MESGWEKTADKFGGRTITIYRRKKENLPLILLNSFMEAGEEILHSCVKHDCPAFQLVSISDLAWDQVLSPWPSKPVTSPDDDFTGGAKDYSHWLDTVALPYAREKLPETSSTILAGYSMGGLFAVYAPYISKSWDKSICASGSVWFPGFAEFAKTTPFARKPEAVYFSLGNKETHSKVPALTTTQNVMEELVTFYESEGILSTFQQNDGNHFQDVPARMAKGIGWTVRAGRDED